MKKIILTIFTGSLVMGLLVVLGDAAEKVQFASIRDYPPFYLTILAAQEKGFWKEQGVEVEWAAMKSGGDVQRATAAGAVSMGAMGTGGLIAAVSRGVPAVIVADLKTKSDLIIYVPYDSPHKVPKDLKGAKVGVTGFGGTSHVSARVVSKAVGIEKEVKFVSTGGIVETVAALKVKAVDAASVSIQPTLVIAREVRELAAVADYLPKEWTDMIVFARKDIIKDKPEVVKRVVKGIVKGLDFVATNRPWSVEKIRAVQGLSEEAARLVYERLDLSRTGRIERKAMENVRNFVIEYEIVAKGTPVPSVGELFTTRFTD